MNTKSHPFSTRRGRKVRNLKLRINPLCERCEAGGLLVVATQVHHKQKVEERPELAFDLDNLESLCDLCHAKAEGNKGPGYVGGCGVDGLPIHAQHPWSQAQASRPKVTIVCGPPGSGKTTWVREHSKPGDLIVDLDELWKALTGLESYDKPESISPFVYEARDAVLRRLDRPHKVRHVWIIHMAPSAQKRVDLSRRYKAQVIMLAVPAEECMRRIGDRGGHIPWQQLIDDWWREYEAREGDTLIDSKDRAKREGQGGSKCL